MRERENPRTQPTIDIEVSVKDGEVTLSETAFDRSDKRIAEDLAESVSGVKNVQKSLGVSASRRASPTATPAPRAEREVLHAKGLR